MSDRTPFSPEGYALVRTIGRGASSVVWEARLLANDEAVALKILEVDASGPDVLRCFARERDAMNALVRHRNILTILAADVADGRPWLAMELCRRGSLASYVADGGPLEVPTALRVLDRLAGALAVAHEAGVLHCDIKPANVMLTDGGEPALGDFGIARVSVGRATTTTTAVGFSLDHVAPELLDDGRRSPRSDVYSLGTTLWQLMVGHPPFRQNDDVSVGTVLTRILRQPLPASERVPADVLAVLRTMTAKDPDERPASMAEVGVAVRALAHDRGLELDEAALPPLTSMQMQVIEALSDRTGPTSSVAPTYVGPESGAASWSDRRSGSHPGSESDSGHLPTYVAPVYRDPAPAASAADVEPLLTAPSRWASAPVGPASGRRSRLPLLAASAIAVLVTAGTVLGIHQMAKDAPAPAPVAIEPAAMVPATTAAPITPTPTPTPTSESAATGEAAPSTRRKRTTTTTPRRRPVPRRSGAPAVVGPRPAPVVDPPPNTGGGDPEPTTTTTKPTRPPKPTRPTEPPDPPETSRSVDPPDPVVPDPVAPEPGSPSDNNA